jgi:AcrR family transcriptional regulator
MSATLINQKPELDRRTRILNAAEALFAHKGYDAVSLREIARLADVDVALASYHFGRKRELFDAVFLRRAEVLNRMRLDALDIAEQAAAPHPATVDAVIEAYLKPLLTGDHLAEEGWRNYYALVAYVNNSADLGGELMSQFFDPMVERFMAALEAALPDARREALFWGYHCLSGALTLAFAQTGRIDRLSRGLCRSDDLEGAYRHLHAFAVGGFVETCGS